jgi:hypothetical protein
MQKFTFLLMLVFITSCRDEQAGPRNRAPKAPSASKPASVNENQIRLTYQSNGTWLNGAVVYLGSSVSPEKPKAGEQVTFKHYFKSTGQVPSGYKFFMHVMDAASGQQIGNLDHEIQNGAAPLGTWPANQIIEDVHGLQMPQGVGPVRLYLGFWNDNGRLPADANAKTDGDNRMEGPTLTAGGPPEVPTYTVPKTATAPKIDGKLDDAVWAKAPEVRLTTSFDGQPTQKKTLLKMLYDDSFLYVSFFAEDADAWGTFRKKDDPIYTEDAVEVFIDANADGATYNEMQVSPHNVNFDASFVARRSDLAEAVKWESEMKTAVFVKGTLDDDKDDEYWTAEMMIPLKNLNTVPRLPPQKGDVWKFNAYRLEHIVRQKNVEGQSFSPLFVGDFHALPRFAKLVFD